MQSDSQDKPTVGATFATSREAMGISRIEAADLLNLTQRTIEALEADDYESLPGQVYVNGYVRAYAKMLGLDADDLIRRSAALHGASDDSPVNDEAEEPASRHYVNKMPISLTLKQWGLVALGLVGLVLLVSFFDYIPRPNNQPVETVRSVAEAGANDVMGVTKSLISRPEVDQSEPEMRLLDTAPEELMDGENLALVTTNDEVAEQVDAILSFEGVKGSGDGQTEPADGADLNISEDPDAMTDAASDTAVLSEVTDADSSSPPGLETEAVAAEEPAANGFKVPYFGEDESGARKLSVIGNEQLRFEFAADCWIEIRGADDALLYADLGRAGQVRRFVGVGPFKLKIGFAEGVKLFFDAQEVDLAPHTRNQMARLELGQ